MDCTTQKDIQHVFWAFLEGQNNFQLLIKRIELFKLNPTTLCTSACRPEKEENEISRFPTYWNIRPDFHGSQQCCNRFQEFIRSRTVADDTRVICACLL